MIDTFRSSVLHRPCQKSFNGFRKKEKEQDNPSRSRPFKRCLPEEGSESP